GDSTEVVFRASWVTWPLFPAVALACSICSKDVIIQGFPLDPAVDSTPRSGCSRAQRRIAANSAADWPLPSKTGVPFMYAVVKTGGKQYKVAPGEKLKVEQIPADVGAEVTLDQVL